MVLFVDEQQKMEKNGVIETRTERRTVITRDGDNIDHDKVIRFFLFSIHTVWHTFVRFLYHCSRWMSISVALWRRFWSVWIMIELCHVHLNEQQLPIFITMFTTLHFCIFCVIFYIIIRRKWHCVQTFRNITFSQ